MKETDEEYIEEGDDNSNLAMTSNIGGIGSKWTLIQKFIFVNNSSANSYEQSSDVNHVAKDVIFGPGEKKYRYCKPSFDKVIPPSFFELGLVDLVSIYSELCEAGNPPPIIDADDLQNDPEGTLCCLCYDLGVPFQASMLKWEAGPKPIDGLGPHGGILVYTNQLVSKHHEHIQRFVRTIGAKFAILQAA
ncbi:hypothetical protein HPP92_001399 [Vanilla planifolia]|uniref:Uncharacterized protein n=1 Tax=Vanilla planifolia TaxID=51239 RepID=A0A835RTX3_VANPL|nr:hypothetical protein HPP92_001399 [Vanilla planifolia]